MVDKERQAGAEVEITREMVEAGVEVLREAHLGDDLKNLARKVFIAMKIESQLD